MCLIVKCKLQCRVCVFLLFALSSLPKLFDAIDRVFWLICFSIYLEQIPRGKMIFITLDISVHACQYWERTNWGPCWLLIWGAFTECRGDGCAQWMNESKWLWAVSQESIDSFWAVSKHRCTCESYAGGKLGANLDAVRRITHLVAPAEDHVLCI